MIAVSMDELSSINITKEHQLLYIIATDAIDLPAKQFKKKYVRRIKTADLNEICDALEEDTPQLVKHRKYRWIILKVLDGLDIIVSIQSSYANDELKNIVERFSGRPNHERKKRASKTKTKNKPDAPKKDSDDESVMFLSQEINFDLEKDLKVDPNAKDKNLIVEYNYDEIVDTASHFGLASKEEILFSWDNVENVPPIVNKLQTEGKYGVFSRAERRVLNEVMKTSFEDEGNFADFPQRIGDALPEVPRTPSKRKNINGQVGTETPSKRSKARSSVQALLDLPNDEGNFADFPQHMEEALPEILATPSKRKSVSDGNFIETPSKRSRKTLEERFKDMKKEPDDSLWTLPDFKESQDSVGKRKKRKKRPVFDSITTIDVLMNNVYVHTVPLTERIIEPRKIVTPAEKLLQIPSSLFAKHKKTKLISQILLKRFQYVTAHPPPPKQPNESSKDYSTMKTPSQLRSFESNPNSMMPSIKMEPLGENLLLEEREDQPPEITTMDSKVKLDEFPVEDLEVDQNITRRPPDVIDSIDPHLPVMDVLDQQRDTVPIEDLNGGFTDSTDSEWDEKYVYLKIQQLCEGSVRITFADLAPLPETTKPNRILVFIFILRFAGDEKICISQSLETEVITIWLPPTM